MPAKFESEQHFKGEIVWRGEKSCLDSAVKLRFSPKMYVSNVLLRMSGVPTPNVTCCMSFVLYSAALSSTPSWPGSPFDGQPVSAMTISMSSKWMSFNAEWTTSNWASSIFVYIDQALEMSTKSQLKVNQVFLLCKAEIKLDIIEVSSTIDDQHE
ncbi:hypothetical protein POM88_012181 [Heracleum sosnowskyi]|uniref:Uncharacterized protein n=1 Tax=Heracleum sosnowskyi TaxID=360622 RepID=A0AAD8IW92_9APIA|nr:hypothetical protein POM88_012181 [Heracleum sosnowskyi]